MNSTKIDNKKLLSLQLGRVWSWERNIQLKLCGFSKGNLAVSSIKISYAICDNMAAIVGIENCIKVPNLGRILKQSDF